MPEMRRPADDATRSQTKRLLRMARFGALATRTPQDGWPMATRVSLATLIDGAPVFLTSALSAHTAALEDEPRCGLLLGEPGRGDPLAHPRLSLFGTAQRLARADDASARRRFLARHPKAALYADFADFAFWRVEIARAEFNGGFGQAFDLDAADLAPRVAWQDLEPVEPQAVTHMNEDHAAAVAHYARICGAPEGGRWVLTGLDPEGMDLALGDAVLRLDFTAAVSDAASLRAALVALARRSA